MRTGLTSNTFRKLQILALTVGLICALVVPVLVLPLHAAAADCPAGQIWQPTYSAATGAPDGGGECVPAPPDTGSSTSSDCDGVLSSLWSPFKCFLTYILGAVSAGLMYLSSWILVLAAKLFEGTLYYTVVQFNVIYDMFKEWVERGWQIFRDLANIGIIGIFTFIAISFILGIKEYGEKRLIANVLIVAVLINFSLLFTKIIINASNAVSSAVYTAQLSSGAPAVDSASSGLLGGVTDNGIAGRFVRSMGLKTFGDSLSANVAIGKSSGFWAQLLYGMFFAFLFVAAAIVFLYGSFLLVARAILLFLLMMTSAAAFATYMIPSLAKSQYGWSTWWNSLLKSAVLIPIMMILLAISIGIAEGIAKNGRGSLGDLVGHPDKPADIMMLLNYFFVLGFLFAAIKISSALSGTIAGFSLSSALAASPFTLGSRYLAAPFGRHTLGRLGLAIQDKLGKKAGNQRDEAARIRSLMPKGNDAIAVGMRKIMEKQANSLQNRAGKNLDRARLAHGLADSKFNVMDSKLGKVVAGGLGIKGIAGGESSKDQKGFESILKERADSAQKIADKMDSGDDRRKQRDLATKQIQATKAAAEDTKRAIERERDVSREAAREDNIAKQRDLVAKEGEMRVAERPGSGVGEAEKLNIARATEAARLAAHDAQSHLQNIDATFAARLNAAADDVKQLDVQAKQAGDAMDAAFNETVGGIGAAVGRRQGGLLVRFTNKFTGDGEKVAEKVRKNLHSSRGTKSTKAAIAEYVKESGGGAAPAAPAAPTTPPPAH